MEKIFYDVFAFFAFFGIEGGSLGIIKVAETVADKFELKKNGYTNQKPINSPDFVIEDFNTDAIVDYYRGHLDEFWWWHEIQKLAKNYTNR